MSAAPSFARTLNTIHSLRGVDPHARLWAAVLASAVADARLGDPEARLWLERCALGYLWTLVPDDEIDCEGLLSTLLAELPTTPHTTRAQTARQRV